MDCEKLPISCQLEEIAGILAQPSLLEVIAVTLSGLAAVGTIWIAVINVRLLRKQHALGERVYEDERRKLRSAHASAAKDVALSILSERITGKTWDATSEKNRSLMRSLASTSEAINDPEVPRPADRVLEMTESPDLVVSDVSAFVRATEEINNLLNAWVQDPHAVDLSKRSR